MLDQLAAASFLRERAAQGLQIHPYQVETALTVIQSMHGSAILADEVGLGKTMEAGLIRAELLARRKGGCRTLVLTPAGLVGQWRDEWRDKFGWRPGLDLTLLSLDTAKRAAARDGILETAWGLVIVDEAHHLKNPRTQNHEFVSRLSRDHLLLLTATPMENQLTELYHLVNLLAPGLFGSYLRFYRQFILDKRTPKNAADLRSLLATVMIRHHRRDVANPLPERTVSLRPIILSQAERDLYEGLTQVLRREYRRRIAEQSSILPLITMQRELCSSSAALLPTLERTDWLGGDREELLALCRVLTKHAAKERALVELLREAGDKVLVFTEYRATARMLQEQLDAAGVATAMFHGDLRPSERDAVLRWFRETGQVLVSTEAGGQGLNLQFCHHLVNYDLPWNPMRIEQRIGRLHRLGQRHPVNIWNLYAQGTVEEDLLTLLHEKINLFCEVVGDLDVILRHLERKGKSLESRLLNVVMTTTDAGERRARINRLGEEFLTARRRFAWPTAESLADAADTRS